MLYVIYDVTPKFTIEEKIYTFIAYPHVKI